MTALSDYMRTLERTLATGDATEHSHRPALQTLLEALGGTGVQAINEPRHVTCGAPDFVVRRGPTPLGYVEAKDIGISLDAVERGEQMQRYLDGLANLVLTDYLEFRWYVGRQHRRTARLGTLGAGDKVRREREGAAQVEELLTGFIHATAPVIGTAQELAGRMAGVARLIRDTIREAFGQEDPDQGYASPLHSQFQGFKEILLHDLDAEQFADMYAQTVCYGLFSAKCSAPAGEPFTRERAAYDLPRTNPFLREMFQNMAGAGLDERIAWAVDDLVDLLNHADMGRILEDFGRRTRREDPVVHFYETFLGAYDPTMREARGVYYTPEPVVSYIVRSVDHLLKSEFGLPDGLADSSKITVKNVDASYMVKGSREARKTRESPRVLILDPACGTGTFLHAVVDEIHERLMEQGQAGAWSGYVSEHLLPRLFGFELLMAPYTVAHMKLGLQLRDSGYDFRSEERLRVYLTNTLEQPHELGAFPLFAQNLAREVVAANEVKEQLPIMVIVGNPPYSNFGQMNRNPWILELLGDYKEGLDEKKLNLDDDFIKFIRWAQWRIEESGAGIVALVTNHTYIDGITHRRMREKLLRSFNSIYVLNLHGNQRRRETTPSGKGDENVFDIQQGVAIGLFVKHRRDHRGTMMYADLWGGRLGKYSWLSDHDVSNTDWEPVVVESPWWFFMPRSTTYEHEYQAYLSLGETFLIHGNGIGTDRDKLFYDYQRSDLEARIRQFYSAAGVAEPFASTYRVTNSSSYSLLERRAATSYDASRVVPCLYRPFDVRFLYYDPALTSRPAFDVMRHVTRDNRAILVTRQLSSEGFRHVFVSAMIVDRDPLSVATRERTHVFPLYQYPEQPMLGLSTESKQIELARRTNLSEKFVKRLSARLDVPWGVGAEGGHDACVGPEDVFHYLYAILHSPTYRARYAEFLKIDFPRIPITSDVELFRALCGLGGELVALHLMESARLNALVTSFPVAGSGAVEGVRYAPPEGEQPGRVYINKAQYFEGIAPEVWQFQIGGYQVLDKWLKDRRERALSFDDLLHYQRIVVALQETMRLMGEIDEAIEAHGGWPIE